jgi:hypothetical protein
MGSPFPLHRILGRVFKHEQLMVVGVAVVGLEIDVPFAVYAVEFGRVEVVHVQVGIREYYFLPGRCQ